MTDHQIYENPLCGRYAGRRMQELFSDQRKFRIWRELWLALAESQQELGLDISDQQLAEMRAHLDDIDFAQAAAYEKELRHDVMAHIRAWGDQCPAARPIIHLGATSAYVGDNCDLIRMKEGLLLLKGQLINVMQALSDFALREKDTACLAYTHYQPAQPTTVGKRAALWLHDLLLDAEQIDFTLANLKLLGCKGTTGTAASFLTLFAGDAAKAWELDQRVAEKMGFSACYPVSGQTYSRKVDFQVLAVLSAVAQSAAKFSNDMRLLCHERELGEPFEEHQVGSSAMAYKRNPMRSERMGALARYVLCDCQNAAFTAAGQWLERSLDDSANKRLSIPEAFLAVDGILTLYLNIIRGVKVYPLVISQHLRAELPFMATEAILMHCVNKGGDRQTLHESIRRHAIAAAERLQHQGGDNNLLDLIAADPDFAVSREELEELLSGLRWSGLAPEQTVALVDQVRPYLEANQHFLGLAAEVSV